MPLFRFPQYELLAALLVCSLPSTDAVAQAVSLQQLDSNLLNSVPTSRLLAANVDEDGLTDAVAVRFDSTEPTGSRIVVQLQDAVAAGAPLSFSTKQILPARLPVDIAMADLDNDGDNDLLVAQDDGNDALAVWLNDGGIQQGTTGDFVRDPTRVAAELVAAVRVLELQPDAAPPRDILLVGGTGRPSHLYATQLSTPQSPTFLRIQTIQHPGAIGAEIGDFNGDGRDDIFFYGTQTQVWLNEGGDLDPMAAIASTPFSAAGLVFSAAIRDLDGDNDLDLVLGTAAGERVYRHDGLDINGEPQFTLLQTFGGGSGISRAFTWIDANGDGGEELVAARGNGARAYSRDGLFFSPLPVQSISPAGDVQSVPLAAGGVPHLWTAALDANFNAVWQASVSSPALPAVSLRDVSEEGRGGYYYGDTVGAKVGVFPAPDQVVTASLEVVGNSGPPIPFSAQIPLGWSNARAAVRVPSDSSIAGQQWIIDLLQVTPASVAAVGMPNRVAVTTFPSPFAGQFELNCYVACMLIGGDCSIQRTQGDVPSNPNSTGLMGTAEELVLLQRLRDERMTTTVAGNDYIDLYESLQIDLYVATFGSPLFYNELWLLKDAWIPAVASIVDGDGSFIISEEMLDRLEAALLQFETHGSLALQSAIARERDALDIQSLAGQPISILQQRWERVLVFSNGFE